MRLPIVWHGDYIAPLKPGHRFPISKYGYLREALVRRGLLPPEGGHVTPAEAGFAQIAAVHAPDYVDRVFSRTLRPEEARMIGLPGTEAVARRARLSAAGTTLAARLALEHGIACNAAGGSHHAGPQGGAGYCVFNDVAVAARALLNEGQVGRVLVLDLDVHQGDGTARIFEGDAAVFTFSMHGEKNYPVRKARSSRDVGLPDGMGDADYLARLDAEMDTILQGFRPDIVFYNAGVDPYEGDRLGRLALSIDGLRARDRAVVARIRGLGIPLVGVLGGGYDDDTIALAERHAILFEEAARVA
ncbi:histone deacetylase [Halovulum dunhuangense]|uniref:Histone deacetylase n=1 Tax=Halovulum dunhuangense TaxID=1505036 RepID=A0A849L302_9RHOB|nr:histone deacetylase [Halovulum dunhuangense]NNU80571.1 histone deacetylase [Halovulum dunhuangense]